MTWRPSLTRAKLETPVLEAVGDAHEVWRIGSGAGPVDRRIVVRDGRGGIAWCHEEAVVGP